MSIDLEPLAWPVQALPRAVELLATLAGYRPRPGEHPLPDASHEPSRAWLLALGSRLGVELEPVTPLYRELPEVITRAAPCLLQIRQDGHPVYLALLGSRGRRARLLAPDARVVSVSVDSVLELLRREKRASATAEIEPLLDGIRASSRALARMRARLLLQRVGHHELRTSWLLRPLGTAPVGALLGNTPALLLGILVNHVLLSLALAGSFWMLGRAALQAHLDVGWFQGWIAMICSAVPLRVLEVWWQGSFSMRVGGLLKQQLLAGVLELTPDEVRLDGIGRHFGRVAESELVELLALGGGLLALLSIADLVLAGVVLQRGAGGGLQAGALALWALVGIALAFGHYAAQRRWSIARVDITHDLLDRMLGHRTRLAQLPLERWHDAEDRRLSAYCEASRRMDGRSMLLMAVLPGGWLVLAVWTLLPAFASGTASASSLAISVGGSVLALRAFDEIGIFFQQISLALTSFEQVRELLRAVRRPKAEARVPRELELGARRDELEATTVLEARGLTYRHSGRARPVLQNCSLRVARGDRILLEGPSGGGKSTLVALLTGLRAPEAGVLLARGLDRATLGAAGWRRRITAAPQFHENHVLSGSFAYNLLLGREWPASHASRDEALGLCRELGLDALVSRMPSGLDELIGETGWQLSHGEKSRLYIARTLLQGGDLMILDESFASLDPETMDVAVRCVLARAPAVLVVSHP